MDEEADTTTIPVGCVGKLGAPRGDTMPCVTLIIDAFSKAVIGTIVSVLGVPRGVRPA